MNDPEDAKKGTMPRSVHLSRQAEVALHALQANLPPTRFESMHNIFRFKHVDFGNPSAEWGRTLGIPLSVEDEELEALLTEGIAFETPTDEPPLLLAPAEIKISDTPRLIETMRLLTIEPGRIHELSPRQFEELTAEVLQQLGHDVELTPASKDGGFDIAARVNIGAARMLMLVECKRYTKPVQVGVVRSLHGVVRDAKASTGLVVTSSRFTRGAKLFEERNHFQMSLADMDRLQEWMREITRR